MDNNTQFRNALNFLLFSYFGITLDYEDKNIDKDNILSCAVKKAFTDATQRGAYYAKSKNKEETEDEKKEKKDAFREATQKALPEATECLKDGINKILEKEVPFDKQDSFDKWHEELCDKIKEKFDSSLKFTYGNAQKWVNMTLKYLYLIDCICSEICPDIDYFHSLQNISAYLHVPVDSYIIEKVWEMEGNKTGRNDSCLPIKSGKTCKNGSRGKYASDKVEAWSTWDNDKYEKNYMKLQNYLRNNKKIDNNPIDWEGPVWIEIAKKRSGKDKR